MGSIWVYMGSLCKMCLVVHFGMSVLICFDFIVAVVMWLNVWYCLVMFGCQSWLQDGSFYFIHHTLQIFTVFDFIVV